jgi:hypothetical protein
MVVGGDARKRGAGARRAANASITTPTVANPALSEKLANIAALIGPTMNARSDTGARLRVTLFAVRE